MWQLLVLQLLGSTGATLEIAQQLTDTYQTTDPPTPNRHEPIPSWVFPLLADTHPVRVRSLTAHYHLYLLAMM